MPPSQIQTGILWQTEEEAGRQCSLCRALSGHSRPAGLSLHSGNFGIHTLVLRQDCRWWQIPLPGETSQHLLSKSTSFNQPSPGFRLGPVRRKRLLGSASSGQLVLVSAQRGWCRFLLRVRDETRGEQGRQMKFLWVHFPLPHSLLQACRNFPMRKCISAWSGKGFFSHCLVALQVALAHLPGPNPGAAILNWLFKTTCGSDKFLRLRNRILLVLVALKRIKANFCETLECWHVDK